ncbi:MAG: helix-hairpin-helix domain-containing protein [Bacteroidales bacterium]
MEVSNWKDLLSFTRNERKGIITLLVLIFLTLLARFLLPDLLVKEVSLSDDVLRRMDSLQAHVQRVKDEKKARYEQYQKTQDWYASKAKSAGSKKTTALSPFAFDPNTLGAEGWQKMGFSSHDVDIIMNYREAGGRFFDTEDVKNLYCISDEQYQQLEAFIQIDESEGEQPDLRSGFDKVLELNRVDTVDLLEVPGIGPFYARQIIKYRSLLGGYISPYQLSEVYGLEEKFRDMLPYFTADSSMTKKIDLNQASYYEILRHPYVDKRLAYQLTEYRRLQGGIGSLQDLSKSTNVPDSVLLKLQPYLKLE